MRVAYVTPFPPQRDGIGDYAAALAEATRAAGNEVVVVRPGALRGAAARLRAIDPDVVHVQFAVAAYGARTAALVRLLRALRPLRARVVVTAHEVTRDTAILRGPGRALYRRIAGLADAVLVHTEASRDALTGPVGADPAGVRVVPHHRRAAPPATTDAASLRARHGLGADPVLLALGFVHVDKGLGDLVEALGRLERGAAHLVVAGGVRRRGGPLRAMEVPDRVHLARVRRRARALGLEPWLHVTGYVPDGEIAPWLDAAAALVLPYRRTEQSGVGSLAAARGVPVVASTAGALVREYGDPRWSFPPADPAALAGALARFLRAPAGERGPGPRADAGPGIDAVAAATLDAYGVGTPTRQEVGR